MSRSNTGPTQQQRAIVGRRAEDRCERCIFRWGQQIHHRRPRQMGGTTRRDTNLPGNLVLLCDGCHDWIENNRTVAYEQGWLVHQTHLPIEVPIWMPRGWVWLHNDGSSTKRPGVRAA